MRIKCAIARAHVKPGWMARAATVCQHPATCTSSPRRWWALMRNKESQSSPIYSPCHGDTWRRILQGQRADTFCWQIIALDVSMGRRRRMMMIRAGSTFKMHYKRRLFAWLAPLVPPIGAPPPQPVVRAPSLHRFISNLPPPSWTFAQCLLTPGRITKCPFWHFLQG